MKYLQKNGEIELWLVRTLRHLNSRVKYIACVVLCMALPDRLNKAVTLQTYILRYLVLTSALRLDMLAEVSNVLHQVFSGKFQGLQALT